MTHSIVVVDPLNEAAFTKMRGYLPPGFALTCASARGDAHLKELLADADFAISGQVAVGGDVLRAARKLKLLHNGASASTISIWRPRALAASRSRAPRAATPYRSRNSRSG